MVGDLFHGLCHTVSVPNVRLPALAGGTPLAEAARLSRELLGLSAVEPVPHLLRSLERAGTVVFEISVETRFPAKHEAYSYWAGDFLDRPFLALRPTESWERRRWSTAHELGHLILHRTPRQGADTEAEANSFAAEFLVPLVALRSELPPSPTLADLLPIKRKWGISAQALIKMGTDLDIIQTTRATSLYKQLSARRWPDGTTWRRREPMFDERQVETPRLLSKMTEVASNSNTGAVSLRAVSGHWAEDVVGAVLSNGERTNAAIDRTPADVLPFRPTRRHTG